MKKLKVTALAAVMIAALSLAACRVPNQSEHEPASSASETNASVAIDTSVMESSAPETTTSETSMATDSVKKIEPEKLPGQDFDVREELFKLRNDASVKQVLVIRCEEGTKGHAMYLVKETTEDGKAAWKTTRECDAYIGLNGPGKTKEGDTKTPLGVFGVRTAFGIKNNPGTKLVYTSITPDTYACSCDKYYNRIIDAKVTGHKCPDGEQMYFYSPEYNYGLATDYNPNNEYGKGSSIFIHCMGVKPYTGGCVAIPEDDLKYIIQDCDPSIKIIIQKF